MSIISIRQQDYWIFPLSFISVLLLGAAFYIGVQTLSVPLILAGGVVLYFTTHVIKKNYSSLLAMRHVATCFIFAALGAAAVYYMTN